MSIVILGNGEINNYNLLKKYLYNVDIIICCDGGLRHAKAFGVIPNYIVGDCDSVSNELLVEYSQKNIQIIKFKKEKDFTDMELGLDLAISLKTTLITILGGMGSRFDHTLGNAHILLKALNNDVMAKLVNEHNEIFLVNSQLTLGKLHDTFISLIPLSTKVSGVSTKGLKYPLKHEVLSIGETRGISNEFISDEATITVEDGFLLVILTSD